MPLAGADTVQNGAVTTAIDYMPLITPVPKHEVQQFRRESKQQGAPWAAHPLASIGVVVAIVVVGIWIVMGVASSFYFTLTTVRGAGDIPAALFPALGPVIVVVLIAVVAARTLLKGGKWEGLLRRTRFAAANGLLYVHEVEEPGYPGAIFDLGSTRRAFGNYRRPHAPELDIGSYRYTTGSGKSRTTHTWGYVALRLPRRLPHMLLDAKGNNALFGASNLPLTFSREQVLSLEGDFDRYFTLYCPKQYERDALYVFTPDLMALLIDESAGFDMEIVEDWMFLYRRGGLDTADPATLQTVFRIVDTVGQKARSQTERYRDERIGDPAVNLVAPQGQRLKRSYRAFGFVAVGVMIWFVAQYALEIMV